MQISPLRMAMLAGAAMVMSFVGSNQASADPYVSIRVGTPPPPLVVEHRWSRPYRGAVWIAGHHEWINGQWVYVAGYYAYPPRPHAYWVAPRYHHGNYYPGHWAY